MAQLASGSGEVCLAGDEAHHMVKVRRFAPGDCVTLFDGSGVEYLARIEEARRGEVRLAIVEQAAVSRELQQDVTLACAVLKPRGMDTLVEKCAELGLRTLMPIRSEHCVVEPGPNKVAKWRRTCVEASKQCRRNRVTEVLDVRSFDEAIGAVPDYERRLFCCLADGVAPLRNVLTREAASGRVICFVGPEGGFSEAEVGRAREAGAEFVSLGPTTLRSETAAIALMAILSYALS